MKDNCYPMDGCPYKDEYENEGVEFCETCINFVRCPDLDKGTNKNNWKLAWICKLEQMSIGVSYQDYESDMPWD